jgi:lysophospholipase L1-like esterase
MKIVPSNLRYSPGASITPYHEVKDYYPSDTYSPDLPEHPQPTPRSHIESSRNETMKSCSDGAGSRGTGRAGHTTAAMNDASLPILAETASSAAGALAGAAVVMLDQNSPASTVADTAPVVLPQAVSPRDPRLSYSGRFDWRDPRGPRCSWPGTGVQVAFNGKDINVCLKDSGEDYYHIIVDGGAPSLLATRPGQERYALAHDLPEGSHVVQIFKRTETNVGTTQILGFELDGNARVEPAPTASGRRIEIIGDSISCGYGNEAKSAGEPFTAETENNYLAYGAVTARALGADYSCIAWSGRKMAPDNTIPEIYDLALPTDPASTWDSSRARPDAMLINLGTNDFLNGIPDARTWTQAYRGFVQHLRSLYPHTHVFCAIGPMMNDGWPSGQQHLSTIRLYVQDVVQSLNQAGDSRVHFLEFPTQDPKDGYGAQWHPNLKTHQKMADMLQSAIALELGWKSED